MAYLAITKKPYLFQQFTYHTEQATGMVCYVCPSVNKGLRALSLAYYCSDTNGGIKYILTRNYLKTQVKSKPVGLTQTFWSLTK